MTLAALQENKRLLITVKLALSLIILVYIGYNVQLNVLYKSMLQGNIMYIAFAFFLLIPNLALQFWKWKYLTVILKKNITNREVIGSLFTGFSTGIITPARVGEFGGRALYLQSINRMKIVGLTIVDKAISLLVTISAGIIGVFYVMIRYNYVSVYIWYPLIIVLVLFLYSCIWLIMHPPFVWKIINAFSQEGKTRHRLRNLFDALQMMQPRQMIFLLFLSTLFYLTFLSQFIFLIAAFEPIRLPEIAGAISSAFFAKTIIPPITFGELGIREGTAMYFLSLFQYAKASAVNASLILFTCNVLLPALIGLFFVPRLSLSPSDNKP